METVVLRQWKRYRLDTVKSFKADVSSVSPSSGRRERSANARNVSFETLNGG